MSAIKSLVSSLGGQTKVAEMLGVKQSHVWNWIHRGQAPAKYIRKLSAFSNGEISIGTLLADHEESHSKSQLNNIEVDSSGKPPTKRALGDE